MSPNRCWWHVLFLPYLYGCTLDTTKLLFYHNKWIRSKVDKKYAEDRLSVFLNDASVPRRFRDWRYAASVLIRYIRRTAYVSTRDYWNFQQEYALEQSTNELLSHNQQYEYCETYERVSKNKSSYMAKYIAMSDVATFYKLSRMFWCHLPTMWENLGEVWDERSYTYMKHFDFIK